VARDEEPLEGDEHFGRPVALLQSAHDLLHALLAQETLLHGRLLLGQHFLVPHGQSQRRSRYGNCYGHTAWFIIGPKEVEDSTRGWQRRPLLER